MHREEKTHRREDVSLAMANAHEVVMRSVPRGYSRRRAIAALELARKTAIAAVQGAR